jgi:hypothetical protein
MDMSISKNDQLVNLNYLKTKNFSDEFNYVLS